MELCAPFREGSARDKKALQGPSGCLGVLQGRTHQGTPSSPSPLAGGTQQRSDRGDPGAHTPSRRAHIAPRPRRSRAHSAGRVCGTAETRAPGQGDGRRGTHLLPPRPSQDPKVQVSPPATDLCVRIYVFILFPSSVEVSPSRCASGGKRTSPSATPPPPNK
ncbi:unnamed protein product [Rangifer tarandus platyrhynchus]|uniref:Uncharacterized protein n=1 Tax=Rangifer tarandus platyrhynchus TaxID=3082113 RepID=A0ABN8ZJ60_RANTA|nr:unnamed protein product [Rangifer tarandus platyrhynchus]